jgi:hypothetical protein
VQLSVGEAILPASSSVTSYSTQSVGGDSWMLLAQFTLHAILHWWLPVPDKQKVTITHTHTHNSPCSGGTAFWDVTFCGPVEIQNHFWGKALPQSLQGLSEIRNNQKAVLLAAASSLSYPRTLKEDKVWFRRMLRDLVNYMVLLHHSRQYSWQYVPLELQHCFQSLLAQKVPAICLLHRISNLTTIYATFPSKQFLWALTHFFQHS